MNIISTTLPAPGTTARFWERVPVDEYEPVRIAEIVDVLIWAVTDGGIKALDKNLEPIDDKSPLFCGFDVKG